jgi:hypothetical protein
MRTSLLTGTALALITSCGTTPPVSVVHLGPGEHADSPRGDPVKIKRGTQEPFAALRGGFFIVRTTEDWRSLWTETNKDPPLPPTLDTSRSMLVLAVGETKDVIGMRVHKVIDTGEVLYVVVQETKPGEGCIARIDRPAFDAVIVDRIDKPVKFAVEVERAEACGAPPLAEATCRIGQSQKWESKLEAQPGDVIECTMTATSRGKFEITDRVLHLDALPGGSSSKLAYTKGPTRGTFTIDVFGKYQVRAEATDDGGRKNAVFVPIEAVPPKTSDVLVELVWSQFDPSDDADTFPRVKLHAREPGPRGHECTAEVPVAGVCEAKVQGSYTHMKVLPAAKQVALTVSYTDERVDKGPLVCIQLYTNGERTGETCDRKHRDPDEKWEVGMLDVTTGKIVDPNAPKVAADAGAGDAGVTKK